MIKISKLTENLPVSQLNLNIFLIYCKKEKRRKIQIEFFKILKINLKVFDFA